MLEKDDVKEKTIDSHVKNCDFFINEFLVYEDAIPANEGGSYIRTFFGYWFIKKAMWASPAAIKGNAASLKNFIRSFKNWVRLRKKSLQSLQRQ